MLGATLAVAGGALAFALKDTGESFWIFELQALGGVLLAAGVLLTCGMAVMAMGDGNGDGGPGQGNGPDHRTVKTLGGLIAVVVGVGAVALLAIVTITRSGENDGVAIASSAFGVISALVGAYLGIKVSTDTNEKAAEQVEKSVGEAAVARQEVAAKERAKLAMSAEAKKQLASRQANQDVVKAIFEAGDSAEESARTANPPPREDGP
jgi:hypothetical protein